MGWREKWSKRVVFGLLILVQAMPILANNDSLQLQKVDTAWWNEVTNEVDYFETPPVRKVRKSKPTAKSNFDWSSFEFLKYVVLVSIAGVLIYFLYRLYGQSMFEFTASRNNKKLLNLSEEELDERFLELDLEKMLKAALKQGNWKMVVRLRFLQVLKNLVDLEMVNWHSDYTNHQIAYQLPLGDLRVGFKKIVTIYEMAWYSNAEVNEQFYNSVKSQFDSYQNKIKISG
jgi:hypothetical protein